MWSNRRTARIRRAWDFKRHGGIGTPKADSPPVVEINDVLCKEVKRTAKAVLLEANGVQAWFPMRALWHPTHGIVIVDSGFHAIMDADQRRLIEKPKSEQQSP